MFASSEQLSKKHCWSNQNDLLYFTQDPTEQYISMRYDALFLSEPEKLAHPPTINIIHSTSHKSSLITE